MSPEHLPATVASSVANHNYHIAGQAGPQRAGARTWRGSWQRRRAGGGSRRRVVVTCGASSGLSRWCGMAGAGAGTPWCAGRVSTPDALSEGNVVGSGSASIGESSPAGPTLLPVRGIAAG